jgi:hypothetical protein
LAVPIIIFVVCLAVGVYASSRWLPELAPGPVGGLSFFVVCGLVGAAFGVFGLRVYLIVENLEGGPGGTFRRFVVANGIELLLWECGLLLGVAAAVYLLAPEPGGDRPGGPDDTPRPR